MKKATLRILEGTEVNYERVIHYDSVKELHEIFEEFREDFSAYHVEIETESFVLSKSHTYNEEQKSIHQKLAQLLINTKEILTSEEREIVLKYAPELDTKYLHSIGNRGWLNINVYSEAEHHEWVLRMEQGI